MVPVPEEHVEEAMAMILRITRSARVEPWTAAAADELFTSVDEATRSVLSAVARGSVSGDGVVDAAVAESIELTQREVLAIVRETNERTNDLPHPPPVTIEARTEKLPNGRMREQRVLTMEPEVAELFREAERAEALAAPHPLAGDRG